MTEKFADTANDKIVGLESCIRSNMTIFRQETFLKKVLQQLDDGDLSILESLHHVLKMIIFGQDNDFGPFYYEVLPEKKLNTINFESLWSANLHKVWLQENNTTRLKFPLPRRPYHPPLIANHGQVVAIIPVMSLTASFSLSKAPCDVLPLPTASTEEFRTFMAVQLMCEILSRTEGPIYNAVRGPGLAYGASISHRWWSGQLNLMIWSASNIVEAWTSCMNILEKFRTNFRYNCDESAITEAKSSLSYEWAENRSVGVDACESAFELLVAVSS